MRDIKTQKHFVENFSKRLVATTGRHSNITGERDFIDGFCLARPDGLFQDTYQGNNRERFISEKFYCMIGRKGKERVVQFQLYFHSGVPTILLKNLENFEVKPSLKEEEIAPYLDGAVLSDDATDMDISFLPAESYYKALYQIMKQWLIDGESPLGNDRKDKVFLALYEELVKINNKEVEYNENPLGVIEGLCWAKEYEIRGTK